MLDMRPDCERCGTDLPPDTRDAHICSFECTFCGPCVEGPLARVCPNCGGGFERRPSRATHLLDRFPAGTQRKGPR